mmetsp:Transcript_11179/g.16043  ORF Transcript_11179/g.16043 Transcript_11179/m.16043 type:complete len:523 (+) Transcript_11179:95-1663(+)
MLLNDQGSVSSVPGQTAAKAKVLAQFSRLFTSASQVASILMRVVGDNFGADIDELEAHRYDAADVATNLDQSNFSSFRLLTQNCWSLPVAPLCNERLKALCKQIFAGGSDGYDCVCLQEVWHVNERRVAIDAARQGGLLYYHYFEQGVGMPIHRGQNGTGMMVLSRWPIVFSQYHRFTVSGRLHRFLEADYVGGKGFGLCRLRTPAGMIDVVTTHLVSNYARAHTSEFDRYYAIRVQQAFELGRFLSEFSDRSHASLMCVAGDLNMHKSDLVVRAVESFGGVKDVWDKGEDTGITFGAAQNCWSRHEGPQRLDYLFFKSTNRQRWQVAPNSAKVVECMVETPLAAHFTNTAGATSVPVSDHAGLEVRFELAGSPSEKQEGYHCEEGVADTAAAPCLDLDMLREAQSLFRGQVQVSKKEFDSYSRQGLLAFVTWVCLISLVAFEIVGAGLLVALAVCFLPAFGMGNWLISHFTVAEELGAVKDMVRTIDHLLRGAQIAAYLEKSSQFLPGASVAKRVPLCEGD